MGVYHPGKIEKREVSGQILAWVLVFLLGVVLILGHVRLYELNLENEALQEELSVLQLELAEKKIQTKQKTLNIQQQAEKLGLYIPQPEEYVVIHVGEPDVP